MASEHPDAASGPTVAAAPPLSRPSLALRLGLLGLILGTFVSLFAYAGGWLTPHRLTPARIIDQFEHISGPHPGFRRNHAKGVGVSGTFTSNGQGLAICKSAVFEPGVTPVLGRFALAGGQPFQADAAHAVRSMALLFKLANGEEWRTGMNNIPVFPAQSLQAFYEQLQASAPDATTGKSDPARMSAFLAENPATAAAMKIIQARTITGGFDDATYNSLNAFLFTNAPGQTVPVRWSMVPVQPRHAPPDAVGSGGDQNALFDALAAAVHDHPLQWRLIITVGEPSDPTTDATLPWPEDRRQIDVGMLTIDHIESEDTSPTRDINFDPLILPNGMASSGDPLLSARSAAYAKSFTRREGEHKMPSAVSPAEVQR